MKEEIKTEKENYITGILGAIVGGTIAAIPWVLAYVYGGMMLSILAALIAAGEFYGYKICKGKVNKKLPVIIMILALVIVTIATLLVIPVLLIQKEGITVNMSNIERLYSNSQFTTAMARDFVISVIFTILGASIITSNVKKQLQKSENGENKDIKLETNNKEETNKIKNEAIEIIKPIFIKYQATTPENAMLKEEVLAEIENKDANKSFNYLKQAKIIKKYKGKYYYSEENENKEIKNDRLTSKEIRTIIAICIIIPIVMAVLGITGKQSKTPYKDSNVSFEISNSWTNTQAQYTQEFDFYKYINTKPASETENNTTIGGAQDYSNYPAFISVYYDKVDTETIKTIEDLKDTLQKSLDASQEKADSVDMDIYKAKQGYDTLKVKSIFNSEPQQIVYYYYILNGEELTCITSYSFNLDDEVELEKESTELADTFRWLQ